MEHPNDLPMGGCSDDKNGVCCESCATANIMNAVYHPRTSIESQMHVMRGRLLTLVETMGLKEKQEDAVKSQVREITGDSWNQMIADCFKAESQITTMLVQLDHFMVENESELDTVDSTIVESIIAEQSKSKHT